MDGDRVSPGRADLGHHLVGGPCVGPFAGEAAADVVDHDLRAPRRQQQRVLTTEPAARTRDDRDAAVKPQLRGPILVSELQTVEVALVAPLREQVAEGVEARPVDVTEEASGCPPPTAPSLL